MIEKVSSCSDFHAATFAISPPSSSGHFQSSKGIPTPKDPTRSRSRSSSINVSDAAFVAKIRISSGTSIVRTSLSLWLLIANWFAPYGKMDVAKPLFIMNYYARSNPPVGTECTRNPYLSPTQTTVVAKGATTVVASPLATSGREKQLSGHSDRVQINSF